MEIDIINYTAAQYAELTAEELLEVRSAQEKKNRLTKTLEEELQKVEEDFIGNGTYHSTMRTDMIARLQAEYDAQVALIKDALIFYLHYASKPTSLEVPYTVDYSLSGEERLNTVKEYYEETYTDPAERFTVFEQDKVARQYLGELYAPLYDYFLEKTL